MRGAFMQYASPRNRPLVEWRPSVRTRLHAASSTGSERLCVLEQLCDPGTGAPPHHHDGVEEVVAVLEGRARFIVAGKEAELMAGESILVPAGARHWFTNIREDALRILAVFPASAPTVEYEGEPEILEIGGLGGRRRDDHRAYRDED
jgi:quercetin dioxygenase-like cupin family protein